jgi:archaellum component FlaF (FlaF/FlaG flagellin family)
MELLSNKTHKQTQTSEDSNVSGTSSLNGSACGGMSKETLIASGTSVSEELKKLLMLPPGTQGTHKRVFCTLF